MNIYLSDEEISNILSEINKNPNVIARTRQFGITAQLGVAALAINKVAKASANHAVREAIKEIKKNLCGSVHIPNSGQRGYDTSHVKLKDDFWQELMKLVEEL